MSRKPKRKTPASAGSAYDDAFDDYPIGWLGPERPAEFDASGVSDRAIQILSMIAEGFTFSQIVNRLAVTPRDIFDSAQVVLDALPENDEAVSELVKGLEDDLPF